MKAHTDRAQLALAAASVGLALLAAPATADSPRAGATYRGAPLSAQTTLSGTLTVSGNGRQIKAMRLLYVTPPCPAAPANQSTALPASNVAVRRGAFRVTGVVRSYAQSGLRGPARTVVKGKFLAHGTRVEVRLEQVIRYPRNRKGCTTQTVLAHGTFSLTAGG